MYLVELIMKYLNKVTYDNKLIHLNTIYRAMKSALELQYDNKK